MKIIECPRDAMQGIHEFIPTEKKIAYLNSLLEVGFDTLDFGSFVSPKAIPQMSDTVEVLQGLNPSPTKLLAIVANERGVDQACTYDRIRYLGFPLSISEEFQKRNTNKSIEEAYQTVLYAQQACEANDKELVVYISMAFGNPYGEAYSPPLVSTFVDRLVRDGIHCISLSDTVGTAEPETIRTLFTYLLREHPQVEFGAHFHSNPLTSLSKIEAAYEGGCRRFDGAMRGFGGCPMAKDDLTGNIATEVLWSFIKKNKLVTSIQGEQFEKSLLLADQTFPK